MLAHVVLPPPVSFWPSARCLLLWRRRFSLMMAVGVVLVEGCVYCEVVRTGSR